MVTRLETLPIYEGEFNLDFHNHIYTNYASEANRWYAEPGPRNLQWLVEKVDKKGLNAMAITNFGEEPNYEFWTNEQQINELPEKWSYYQDDKVTAVQRDDGNKFYFFKSREITTDKGHILVFGEERDDRKLSKDYKPEIKHYNLEESLDEAEKKGLLKIADHTYSSWDGVGRRLEKEQRKKLKEERKKLGLWQRFKDFTKRIFDRKYREEKLREYMKRETPIKRFDAFEYNSNTRISNRKTEREADRYNMPLVVNSDAHRARDIGSSYNVLKSSDLKYKSGQELVNSIRDNVRNKKFEVKKGKNSLGSILHHVFMVGWYNVLKYFKSNIPNYDPGLVTLASPSLATA